jgi:hypothetical protein
MAMEGVIAHVPPSGPQGYETRMSAMDAKAPFHGFLCACVLTAALCQAATAQIVVSGRVVDENGVAVAGAGIELGGKPAVAAATSDQAGNFSAGIPSPGEYSLRAERPGFYLFELRNQEFSQQNTHVTITLNHIREYSETVDVVGSAPVIDPQQPSQRQELDNEQAQAIPYPAPQDYRSSLPLMNGVLQDQNGELHVNGGGFNQTSYTLNGFNIADPVTGRLEARINTETIQSADLETSRFSVESGRGSAGVLDLKTRMGDDHWRLGVTNFVPSVSIDSGLHLSKWTPRAQVSGPIAKGRAWFHNGFDAFYDVDVVPGLPDGRNRSRSVSASNLARVQVNVTPSNIFTASLLANLDDRTHQGLSILTPIEATVGSRRALVTGSVHDSQYLGGALLSVGFAQTRIFEKTVPEGDALYQITPFGNAGNYFERNRIHSWRRQWIADLFLPLLRLEGQHQLKTGIDVQQEGFVEDVHRHDFQVLRADYSLARFVTFAGPGRLDQKNFDRAWYFQDYWTLWEGLAVQWGLRLQRNSIAHGLNPSPRAAVVWAPKAWPGTKLSGGWGVYYDAFSLGALAQGQGQVSAATFYSGNGVARGPLQTSFRVDPTGLSLPRYTAVSAGIEQKTPLKFYVKAEYIRRAGDRGLVFMPENPLPGEGDISTVYGLQNARRDRYRAVDLSVHRTFAGKYEWFAGYTRSSSRTSAVVDYSLDDPIFAPQAAGPYAWDAPNRFHMWGWAPVPAPGFSLARSLFRELTAAYLVEYRTGFPFSVVNDAGFQVGPPGSRRFPDYFNINLHFEKKFRVLSYLWAWRFGFNNLTNNGNPNIVNNIIGTPQFLTYGRGQARSFSVRLRLLGRK